MKKFVVVLAVLCLAFAVALTYLGYVPMPLTGEKEPADAAVTEPTAAEPSPDGETAAPVEVETLDYEALYALHDPAQVVMTVDGKDITWGEYFSWLYMSAMQTEQYFVAMANYGVPLKWSDAAGEDGSTYADAAIAGGENTLRQLMTILGYAESQGIEASQETLDAIQTQRDSDKTATVGEDGTEEDFAEYLHSLYRSEEAYQRATLANYINMQNFTDTYGLNGEKVSDEQTLAFLEEQGYLRANHILLSTIDLQTGEALEESDVAEKAAQAQELVETLQAIAEPEKLVERFGELKEQYCEDSGRTAFPDGYVFLPGEMVTEFEDGVKALADYGVSQPVQTSYGYHVILRLPLSADAVVSYDNTGAAVTGRSLFANFDYASGLDAYLNALSVEYADDFHAPDLSKYVK